MQLTVLTWIKDFLIGIIGKLIELIFRVILCLLPLGIYMLIIQGRSKASSISSISVYTNDSSAWQHVFPGFILVAVDPNVLEKRISTIKKSLDEWVDLNKYLLALLFMILMVALMLLGGRN